jgi:hypothetical protein
VEQLISFVILHDKPGFLRENTCKIGLIIANLSWKCNEKYGINTGILRVENDFTLVKASEFCMPDTLNHIFSISYKKQQYPV